jgi:hypothetical protein
VKEVVDGLSRTSGEDTMATGTRRAVGPQFTNRNVILVSVCGLSTTNKRKVASVLRAESFLTNHRSLS